MKLLKNFSNEQLARGGIIVGIATMVVGTAADIVDRVRHDKRRKKLYATLQVKADEVDTNLFNLLETEKASEEES